MFFIYFLYSPSSDIYYVGQTENWEKRISEHNESPNPTFTSKHRPWILKAVFECGIERSEALKLERFIKQQKSRILIEKIITGDNLTGKLSQLVRVPHMRD